MAVTSTPAAWETSVEGLYRRHARDVFALAYRAVGSRAEAEDVAQTTFLNAHRALLDGVEPIDERAWLLAIARNVCRSRFRALHRRPREEPLDESLLVPSAEEGDSPVHLADALRALLPRQRAALVMQTMDGCTTTEIGARLGLGQTAVDALLHRARAALRDELHAGPELAGCARTEALVQSQLRHELGDEERAALRAHLRRCGACATLARRLRARKRVGSLLWLPWDFLNRLAGLFGQSGAATKVATVLGAVTIGTTVAVETGTHRQGRAEAPIQHPAVTGALQTGVAPLGRIPRGVAVEAASSRRHEARSLPEPATDDALVPPALDTPAGPAAPRAEAPAAPSAEDRPAARDEAPGSKVLAAAPDGATGSALVEVGDASASADVALVPGGAAVDAGISTSLVEAGAHLDADLSPRAGGVAASADVSVSAPAVGAVDVAAEASSSNGVSAAVGVSIPGSQPTAVTAVVPAPSALLPLPTLPTLPQLPPRLGG